MNVSVIFKERPRKWGLRGDPFLWDDMDKFFDTKSLPYTRKEFKTDFFNQFFVFCGRELGTEMMTYVPRYARGGMSSGMVSHDFWQNTALPLLLTRLNIFNNMERTD